MRSLLGSSIVARVPSAMLSIALLVHAQALTGSFAIAGIVSAAYAVALGVGGPALGRAADRRGQTGVLIASAAISAALLVTIAVLPRGASPALLVLLAAGIGAATPPVGACLRALLPGLIDDRQQLERAFAMEAAIVELAWVSGPPLALMIGAVWSTGAALAAGGLVGLAATVLFATRPAARAWRPTGGETAGDTALRSAGVRMLVLVMLAVGAVFGAVEVAVTAGAEAHGGTAGAAPLLSLWGAGSLVGGLVVTRTRAPSLTTCLAALAATHAALAAADGDAALLGALLLAAGATIAPTYAVVYAHVDAAAPTGTVTEAFAWLTTAAAVGAAAGTAAAGALAGSTGAQSVYVLAGLAGTLAVLTALARGATVTSAESLA